MRSILLAAVLSLTTLATARPADACGGYGQFVWRPQVFALSTHGSIKSRPRFVVFRQAPTADDAKKLQWTRLDRRSFDHTVIAHAGGTHAPLTFTLVGPSGAIVVKATQRVWIDIATDHDGALSAMRVPSGGDYRLAILGEHRDATWEAREAGDVVTVRGITYAVQTIDGVTSVAAI